MTESIQLWGYYGPPFMDTPGPWFSDIFEGSNAQAIPRWLCHGRRWRVSQMWSSGWNGLETWMAPRFVEIG